MYLRRFFNAGLGIILLGYFTLAGHRDIHLMNGLKLLVSALVALIAIAVFGVGELIAWREGHCTFGHASGRLRCRQCREVRESISRPSGHYRGGFRYDGLFLYAH